MRSLINRIIKHVGSLAHSFVWLFTNYNKFNALMTENGIAGIRIEKFYLWKKHGKYFSGKDDKTGELVFVKLASHKLVESETNAIRIISQVKDNTSWLPIVLKANSNCVTPFIIFNNINGVQLNKIKISALPYTIQQVLVKQMLIILLGLNKSNIIHRDIRPHNMIFSNNRIKLIDFAYSTSAENPNSQLLENKKLNKELVTLGHEYNPQPLHWDDAYSMYKIILNQFDSRIIDEPSAISIKEMIGKNAFKFKS